MHLVKMGSRELLWYEVRHATAACDVGSVWRFNWRFLHLVKMGSRGCCGTRCGRIVVICNSLPCGPLGTSAHAGGKPSTARLHPPVLCCVAGLPRPSAPPCAWHYS